MSRSQLKKLSDEQLLNRITDLAIAYSAAMEQNDYKLANRNADRISATYLELRARGTESRAKILSLLDGDCRVWPAVAGRALEFAPDVALPVLTKLLDSPRFFERMNAKITLSEWNAGNLRFD